MKLCTVVGARPNFVKMAPIILEARRRGMRDYFVHTGQHYDERMSKVFFDDLGMPAPDAYLGVGGGSHAEQTARIMTGFEEVLRAETPDLVVVAGDVNSTLACGITAAKLQIPVAHVESGLRSFDRGMPEEINRVLTDHLSDLLFTTEPSGNENLAREGLPSERIHYVGNTMIDSLRQHEAAAVARAPWRALGLDEGEYGVVTLHRPSNVDDPETARPIAQALAVISEDMPLVFPVHPRTLARSGELFRAVPRLRLVEPLPYLEFLGLMARARFTLTDSGGIQEETTALGVPCLTVRRSTERPVTVTVGTNTLSDPEKNAILAAYPDAARKRGRVPELWDGHAARRVVDVFAG